MTAIKAEPGEPAASADPRRLGLLRRIADGGGRITPEADPQAQHGYQYPALGDAVESDLEILARRDYLEERFFDRVSLCPKCQCHHLNVREICPACRRAHLAKEGLLHHFSCGYSGIVSEFKPAEDGSYVCPKCNRRMYHLGTEFDRFSKAFVCRDCGIVTENPPVEAVCLACAARTPAEDLVSIDLFSYVLTSQGAAALRRGSLLDSDSHHLFIGEAPVYRRKLILELLDNEMKRANYFNNRFSVLLVECMPERMGGRQDSSSTLWLNRLRQYLRPVDLIGQLDDGLYVAILPRTRRRMAEALRQHILTALGADAPLTLLAIEIAKPKDLVLVLARRAVSAPA
jgi:hypothetical protein